MACNLFSDNFPAGSEFRSFSDLLSGAMPPSADLGPGFLPEGDGGSSEKTESSGGSSGFRQNRPGNLVFPASVLPVFALSPGISPSDFLNSPNFFSSALSPYGISTQQAQKVEATMPSSLTSQPSASNTLSRILKKPHNFPAPIDKPAEDGYNWRKYGQKHVKGSETPRSYYRCTNHNCPVRKKVERSLTGHITEIIYKGQHNHERRGNDHAESQGQMGASHWSTGLGRDHNSAQAATSMQLNGPSDSEGSGENYEQVDEDDDENQPNAKRRNSGAEPSNAPFTHKTMTEPKIVVQTRSEVDLLDDGYRWRKYGQKLVKGNPNPRSYYKCTTVGCNVRKHVERASTDTRAVITTYEGKHSHDVPVARGNCSNTIASEVQQQTKIHNPPINFGNNDQMSNVLRLKEEQNCCLMN